MKITENTMLAELLKNYPWVLEELGKISGKFKLLDTPVGKALLNKATIEELCKKVGIDADSIIKKLTELIQNHGA
ncbi:MAG: DUF1858 domain-containing protein [Oscillospiraceae bacterium]|nr:DUF1858 domain-containing protein [Oscillospiraceae bacterium]